MGSLSFLVLNPFGSILQIPKEIEGTRVLSWTIKISPCPHTFSLRFKRLRLVGFSNNDSLYEPIRMEKIMEENLYDSWTTWRWHSQLVVQHLRFVPDSFSFGSLGPLEE